MPKSLDRLQPWGASVLRLALGLSMAVHGYQKVVPHNATAHFAHYVVSLGMSYWLGVVSAYTEFFGGVFVLLGLLTRLAAAFICINMLVALITVGIHQGFGIYNYIFAFVAIAFMLVVNGAGALSLDRRIGLS
ncbi:DoxX family protein [Terriglobus saanensis]|uniref:DoxX family protein n=1 Tax=Terriglobus saanensis (strain ATCC BAA-1853 / DSM 23119 / SP1PR4) TaxID=401053 RepID=E8V0M1_TERSS|nr:DoxX family protein [Terriglobus saanensis]ADV81084.1 DoxX family protein [Terriglobus saanensis SP1PR4]